MRRLLLGALAVVASACGDTGKKRFAYPLYGIGAAATPVTVGEYTLTLARAELTFGPAYFCPTAASSPDLCPVAQAEYTDARVVNLLDGNDQPLGDIDSLAGRLRTVTFDLGYSWFPRDSAPRLASDAAGCPEHCTSAYFELTIEKNGVSRALAAPISIVPIIAGARAIGATPIDATVVDASQRLEIAGDPNAWWSLVLPSDLDAIPSDATVLDDGLTIVNVVRQAITIARPLTFTWKTGTAP